MSTGRMNLNDHNVGDTCRTCLAQLTQADEKHSLVNCSAVTSQAERLQLIRNIMAACSITPSSNEDQDELLDITICSTCVQHVDNMLTFIEQCIRSQRIIRDALRVKQEKSALLPLWCESVDDPKDVLPKPEIVVKTEMDGYDDTSGFTGFDPDDVPLSMYTDYAMKNNNEPQKHQCHECHKTFRSAVSLMNHRYKHTGDMPHACPVCDQSFRSVQGIKRHMAMEHDGARYKPYVCRLCSELFPSRYHLNRHEQRRHNSKVYACTTCKKSFASFSSLKFHQNIHLGIRPYSCSFCPKTFTSASVLRDHKKNIHSNLKKFECHCGRSFNRKKKLEFHVDAVHEKKDKMRKYHCPECDKKFHHPYSLKNHLNTHLGVKPYLCNVCGAAFTSPSNLRSHFRRIHSGEKKRPEKIHLCHNCGESFSRASHLKRHTLRKHIPNAEKKYECPVCHKRFLEKSDVTGHIKLHDDFKPYVCSQCTKCFRTSWRLQAHVNRVHLGLRPFECPTCTVKFKTKSHLEKHIRTHTGEKPFPCPHCAYTCAEKSNLKKHINIHLKAR